MDTEQFDRLARDVNHVGTRRGALRLLGGGALAGALALFGNETASARCHGPRKGGGHKCCPKSQICGDKETKTCVTGKGTCSAGDNICTDSSNICNGNDLCGCLQTKEGGKTRCVNVLSIGNCCGKDSDCVAAHPDIPGAVCIGPVSGCDIGCPSNPANFNGGCYAPCAPAS